VVLSSLAGYAAMHLGGVPSGLVIGVLVGFIVAPFVPLPASKE
jgi:hypothetical protein